jgi:hypothetical protein
VTPEDVEKEMLYEVAPATADQLTVTSPCPAVAPTPVGTSGRGAGVGVAVTWLESALSPLAFTAVTRRGCTVGQTAK